MNIKSLLLGSAAALAVVSGAQAADAIVAAEPEPMEYVRVCDAFGTGYFYIPGTETCLQIGGWVRAQVDFGPNADSGSDNDYDMRAAALVTVDAKSDTELGVLQSFIALESDISVDDKAQGFYADEAYLALGGFKAGWFYNWWDLGIAGETDGLGNQTEFVSFSYTYTAESFSIGASVDEIETIENDGIGDGVADIGLSGTVTATFGPASIAILGGYDFDVEEGAVRAIGSAEVGPGTFYLAGIYSSDPSAYYDDAEWSVAASYAFKATDKLTITPGIQYWDNLNVDGVYDGDDKLKYGITLDYKPVENLLARVSLQYDDELDNPYGYFRLQRAF
ncbi:porin [Rhizobium sp. PDO1-076]|uniref:porin n=1 Tax=Rhizobium sp. PDO1-076 TaxID=1125979 RepID=UPI00024E238E|nr:porin [Rhizobium sp. PDO1-076]EHS52504.1 porin [Rhizobium sp. PDO1-076]